MNENIYMGQYVWRGVQGIYLKWTVNMYALQTTCCGKVRRGTVVPKGLNNKTRER